MSDYVEPFIPRGMTTEESLVELASQGLSRQAIAERVKIYDAEQVDRKIKEALAAPDWLTEAQQERAMLRMVQINLAALRDMATGLGDVDAYHDNAKIQLAYIDRIFARFDKRRQVVEDDLEKWNANVGREIGAIVDEALAYMKGALRNEISGDDWETLKADAMRHAWARIEAKQIQPSQTW